MTPLLRVSALALFAPALFAPVLFAPGVAAQAPHHAIPGAAREGLDARVRGLVLLGELGCASCHDAGALGKRILTRTAPDLAAVGARVDPRHLAAYLADPQRSKPGTTMPHLLSGSSDERQKAAAALTQFLVSLSAQRFTPTAPDLVAARRGKELFHSIGCVACHLPRDEVGEEVAMADSIPLGRLEAKYSIASLTAFLDDPRATHPSGRMPHFELAPRESADLANYLLERAQVPGRLKYTLYLGAMGDGLDRLGGKEHSTGVVDALQLGRWAQYESDFAVRFAGFLRVEKAGRYDFELACDRGGRLQIGGASKLSIDAGGRQSVGVELAVGRHEVAVTYLHVRGDRKLDLLWSGPGLAKQPIAATAFSAAATPAPAVPPLRLTDAQIARGKTLYSELDCVRCHELPGIAAAPARAPMKDLDLTKGCLSATGKGPRFALAPEQVKDIRAVLEAPSFELTDEQEIHKYLAAFNCVACHQRGKLGGVTKLRDDHFQSVGENLGLPSRIPPPLTGVGAKLQSEWLANAMAHGKSIRPMMKTRMPGFGVDHTAPLAALFEKTDSVPAVVFDPLPKGRKPAEAVRKIGQELAGDRGMNCIACHPFGGRSHSTMISVDLVDSTTKRLRKDWFYHYLVNPVSFRPGTIMPLFFPGGVSTRKDLAGGDAKQQINALWHYLDRGRNVRAPRGLVRPSMAIEVTDEPVILRRSAQNTGKRGISVGLPEKVSYTFDAETIALNQIWWGRFIDPGPVWSGQGSGQVRILERERVTLPKGPAFAALSDDQAAWPTVTRRELGHQFRGYDLDDARRPVFRYECEGVTILDAPVAVKADGGGLPVLRRTFTFAGEGAKTLYFRAAVDEKIEAVGDGLLRVGRFLDLRVPAGTFVIRETTVADKPTLELLIRVAIHSGSAKLVIRYTKREQQK